MKPKTTLEKISKKVKRLTTNLERGAVRKQREQAWPRDLNGKRYGKSVKKAAPIWGYDP